MYESLEVVYNRLPSIAEKMTTLRKLGVNITAEIRNPIFSSRNFQHTFYGVIEGELEDYEKNVLQDLLNLGTLNQNAIQGNYCIYEHYLQTRGLELFYSVLVQAIARDRRLTKYFLQKPSTEFKKMSNTTLASIKLVKNTEESIGEAVNIFMLDTREKVMKDLGNQRIGLPINNIVDMEIKEVILEMFYEFEHNVHNGVPYKLWYTDKKLGNESGLTVDLSTLGTDSLKKLLISFISSTIVGFLGFIKYTSHDLTFGRIIKKEKPIRLVVDCR